MKENAPLPNNAAEKNWFESEEPLVGLTFKRFDGEKTKKQVIKAAEQKAKREARNDRIFALQKEVEMEFPESRYPRGKFYTLTSEFEDLEA